MTVARDVMTPAPRCVREGQTLREAAAMMATLNVGALPICGDDGKLKGMLTDRDIVVKAIAAGADPSNARAGDYGEGAPTCVHADDDIRELLRVMQDEQIRRVLVLEDHDLVGIVSQADIALATSPVATGETVAAISE